MHELIHAAGTCAILRMFGGFSLRDGGKQDLSLPYDKAKLLLAMLAIIRELLAPPTGETLFVDQEADLDAVTALSGSGPAYVFFFLEALTQAAVDLGLRVEQGQRLAEATFKGSTSLARTSDETLQALRARVTSKGGTTHAAIRKMESDGVMPSIVAAVRAAQARAHELADEFDA